MQKIAIYVKESDSCKPTTQILAYIYKNLDRLVKQQKVCVDIYAVDSSNKKKYENRGIKKLPTLCSKDGSICGTKAILSYLSSVRPPRPKKLPDFNDLEQYNMQTMLAGDDGGMMGDAATGDFSSRIASMQQERPMDDRIGGNRKRIPSAYDSVISSLKNNSTSGGGNGGGYQPQQQPQQQQPQFETDFGDFDMPPPPPQPRRQPQQQPQQRGGVFNDDDLLDQYFQSHQSETEL